MNKIIVGYLVFLLLFQQGSYCIVDSLWSSKMVLDQMPLQGSLTEGKGSVQLTSLYRLVRISFFLCWKYYLPFYKTSYLNEEVNRTEPSGSVSVPWQLSSKSQRDHKDSKISTGDIMVLGWHLQINLRTSFAHHFGRGALLKKWSWHFRLVFCS
jgi:hypothetical protein